MNKRKQSCRLFGLGCLFYLLLLPIVHSQSMIKGWVLEEATGYPLMGATIISTAKEGTISDEQGYFQLQTTSDSLTVSFVGYLDQQVIINGEEELRILVQPDLSYLVYPAPTVSAAPINSRVPLATFKLQAQDWQKAEGINLIKSLNRVSGILFQSGALNTNRLTLRGIGSRSPFSTTKIRAYFDDIPLTNGVGETTIEDIDPSTLQSVEIWKGPAASTYGAGLGGVILLKSLDQPTDAAQRGQVNTQIGSYGLIRSIQRLNFRQAESGLNMHVHHQITHSDGYRDNNEYDRQSFSLMGKLASSEKSTTSLLFNYIKLKAFIPSSINQEDFDEEPTKAAFTWGQARGNEDYTRWMAGLAHTHYFIRQSDWPILSNTTSIFTHQFQNDEVRPFNVLDENSQSIGFRNRLAYRQAWRGGILDLSLGGEYFLEHYKWQTFETIDGQADTLLSNNREVRTYGNIFAEAQWRKEEGFFISTGLNLNLGEYDYTDKYLRDGEDFSGDYRFDAVWSPRLGLGYQLLNQHTLFLNISHGFSRPTLEETLTPNGLINPNIDVEQGWNFEIGGRGHLFSHRLLYEWSLYQMRIRDLLVARRTAADEFIGINAGRNIHNGLEIYLAYRIVEGRNAWSTWASYTLADYRFDDFVDGEEDHSGNPLTGMPPHMLNMGLDAKFHWGSYAHLTYRFVDAMPLRDDNSIESESFQVVDIKLGHRLGRSWQVDFNVGINNLLNTKYAAMLLINAGSFGGQAPRYFYPGLPRNFYGAVDIRF